MKTQTLFQKTCKCGNEMSIIGTIVKDDKETNIHAENCWMFAKTGVTCSACQKKYRMINRENWHYLALHGDPAEAVIDWAFAMGFWIGNPETYRKEITQAERGKVTMLWHKKQDNWNAREELESALWQIRQRTEYA